MTPKADDVVEVDMGTLRAEAMDRTASLLQQLGADQADLAQWVQRGLQRRQPRAISNAALPGKAVEMQPGVNTVARVMEAAQRVRARLQGG